MLTQVFGAVWTGSPALLVDAGHGLTDTNAHRGHLPIPARAQAAVENLTEYHGVMLML